MKYRLQVCREYWGTVDIEAESEEEAFSKFEDGEYESFFLTGKVGNESAYNAQIIEEASE